MSPQDEQGDTARVAHRGPRGVEMDNNYRDKAGNTVLHLSVWEGPAQVHACAAAGVYINAQNFAGDTALHVAVREGQREAARALLMAGTDLTMKNKLGQTVSEVAPSDMKDLVHEYRPGLVHAVTRGEFAAINRLVNCWCNPNSNIKDGKSALTLLSERSQEDGNFQRCYNLLRSHQSTLELIHAVFAEDVDQLKRILQENPNCNVNTGYMKRGGWTPVACAVFQQNLELLQALVSTGRAQLQLRVRRREMGFSQPLYFCTLQTGCPQDLWRYVHQNGGDQLCLERNYKGDTAFFSALERGQPCSFLQELLAADQGVAITQKNKDGLTPRQVALETGRNDVVELIDKYLFEHLSGELLMRLPVTFYGKEQMTAAKDQSGRTLQDCAVDLKCDQAVQATKHYQSVEDYGLRLFQAASTGDLKSILRYNKAPYIDQNGYTALTRAIVFDQLRAAEILLIERPELRLVPDNCNRYPLHYAYSLPDEEGRPFIDLLLNCEQASDLEHRLDKDGREAAEYRDLRGTDEVKDMLEAARTRDPYGKAGAPMGPTPNEAEPC